jgi:hypothetical protein
MIAPLMAYSQLDTHPVPSNRLYTQSLVIINEKILRLTQQKLMMDSLNYKKNPIIKQREII